MNIFFAGAVRGGRAHQAKYPNIIELLKKNGTVFSDHIADSEMTDFGETDLTKEEIHDREMGSLEKSDVVVAEVSTPSLGVGYLIAQGLNLDKRVVCLYHGSDTYKLSAMIKGNEKVEVYTYEEGDNLEEMIGKIF